MVAQSVVRGQYAPGRLGDKPVPGYREEPNVNQASKTETFVAGKLLIDNWRWAGVPFYLRTGKRLAKRSTEIMIQFRRSEEHTSELQSQSNLVCRLLLEKKKTLIVDEVMAIRLTVCRCAVLGSGHTHLSASV